MSQLIFFIFFSMSIGENVANEYIKLKAILHVHTKVSTGEYSFEEIAQLAKNKGIDVIGFTDHDFLKFEYGIPPLRNIIKKVIEYKSVSKYGFEKYMSEIKKVNEKFPDMIFLSGVETAPFYYWEIENNEHIIRNWHKHMLVFGLTHKDLKKLPTILNPKRKCEGKIKLSLFYPLISLILSFVWIIYQTYQKIRTRNKHRLKEIKISKLAIFIFIISIIFSYNNYPFCERLNQYKGDQGVFPYQVMIDYVNSKGGVIIWAHPEENWNKKYDIVIDRTYAHPEDLYLTHDYTGFAAFWVGTESIKIGGRWDHILNEYCIGKRKKPVWIVSELDYKKEENNISIDSNVNILLVKNKSENECINALKAGRFYIERGYPDFELEEFTIIGITKGTFGEIVSFDDKVKIKIRISAKKNLPLNLKIIRNGKNIYTIDKNAPFEIEIDDLPQNNTNFYRIEISENNDIKLLSNPVFVFKNIK